MILTPAQVANARANFFANIPREIAPVAYGVIEDLLDTLAAKDAEILRLHRARGLRAVPEAHDKEYNAPLSDKRFILGPTIERLEAWLAEDRRVGLGRRRKTDIDKMRRKGERRDNNS